MTQPQVDLPSDQPVAVDVTPSGADAAVAGGGKNGGVPLAASSPRESQDGPLSFPLPYRCDGVVSGTAGARPGATAW